VPANYGYWPLRSRRRVRTQRGTPARAIARAPPPADDPPVSAVEHPQPAGAADRESSWWFPLAILAAAQFVMVLDSSVMNVSISQIVADLDTTIQGVQLAITAYTLVDFP
jgi:hypothetical protein